ncbi:caspase domain-containing protein [Crucibulum laeve]|uniref:Caspase domain-containing protein n=1 Tax=Crucibulum laeve TaxID=68775 RepID=A0A5C3LWL8_9AGAR|nr:caspase domain-containing protein [Crucibulum laeve]
MMWDTSGGNAYLSQPMRSPSPNMRMPSPGFPVPQHVGATAGGSSYPSVPGSVGSYLSPTPEYHGHHYDHHLTPRAITPQPSQQHVIYVHHSSHKHHHHRHRKNSHSHSRPPPAPLPISQSTSYQTATSHYFHHASSPSVTPNAAYQQQPVVVHHQKPSSHSKSAKVYPPIDLNPHFQYSKCTGRKKALCVGINYIGQPNELRGCVNDAKHVKEFLINHQGYRAEDIVLLTDDSSHPRQLPTRQNIIDAMKWLVRSARTNDSLFFHYSGHGGQTPDKDGDEVDGWDEVIYPMDFKKRGHIIDDEMHDIMVKSLPKGCRLTALFDSCHSGTVLDLPYIYSSSGRLKGSHVSSAARARNATPADVISWSGCKDGQTSADTFAGGVAVGAMSYAFITALTRKPVQTYQELLRSIRLILHPRYSQKPQLGSSHHIDTNLRFVL